MIRKALYGGSFDPFSLGHGNIVLKAHGTFDELHIGIGTNPKKTRLFTVEESVQMIRDTIREMHPGEPYEFEHLGITVGEFTGKSITQYAREIGATHIVRGLRQASDFNDEFIFRGAIEKMAPELVVTHFICDHEWMHVSSSTARDLARLNEDVSWLVGESVQVALREKFRDQ